MNANLQFVLICSRISKTTASIYKCLLKFISLVDILTFFQDSNPLSSKHINKHTIFLKVLYQMHPLKILIIIYAQRVMSSLCNLIISYLLHLPAFFHQSVLVIVEHIYLLKLGAIPSFYDIFNVGSI